MKIAKVFILSFALTALLAAIPCQAGDKRPFNSIIALVGQEDPGVTTFSGKMTHIRDQRNVFSIDASDDRLDGIGTSVFNANLDATGSGQIWGTFQIVDAEEDVVWEGSWQGQIYNMFLGQLNWITSAVMHGLGEYEGLKTTSTMAFDTIYDLSFFPWIGYEVGEIKNASDK